MSLASDNPLSPPFHDAIQVSRESEQNLCELLKLFALGFCYNRQIQESGSGIFANARGVIITGSTFIVSLSCRLYKQL